MTSSQYLDLLRLICGLNRGDSTVAEAIERFDSAVSGDSLEAIPKDILSKFGNRYTSSSRLRFSFA